MTSDPTTGSVYIFVAIATLIGTPTAGAILKTTDEAQFTQLIIFSGALMAAGTLILCAVFVVDAKWFRTLSVGEGARAECQ